MKAQLSLALGRKRRDRGVQARGQRDPLFHAHAMAAIHELACCGGEFTSDDVHDRLGGWTPTHVNSLGSAIHAAVSSGIIERVGYRQSTRPEAHARVIAVYRGAGRSDE